MILLSPSKETAKDPKPARQEAKFQKEAENLMPEIKEQDKYEAWSFYHGLAFRCLKEEGFTEKEIDFMEQNLCIFSALYGLLAPKDGIVKYRLDFSQKGLYSFWGSRIYKELKERLQKREWIINLASDEFAKTITKYLEEEDLFLQVDFLREEKGVLKKHSTTSKKGRGAMARYLVKSGDTSLRRIQSFREDGYRFSEELSENQRFVFVKKED